MNINTYCYRMIRRFVPQIIPLAALALFLASVNPVAAQPQLVDPDEGVIDIIADDVVALWLVDGLAFDEFGNLIAAREVTGAEGGLVYIDIATGQVTPLVSGISRADQVALGPDGLMYVTSETAPGSTDKLFRVILTYDANGIPTGATAVSLGTDIPITGAEGMHAIFGDTAFGPSGTLVTGEDQGSGRVMLVNPLTGETTVLLDSTEGLNGLEGLVVGDFGGALAPAIYVSETGRHRIVQLNADGSYSTFGDPTAVGLRQPDNVEFGPDGFLYAIEDVNGPTRIIRISSDGTHSVFLTDLPTEGGLIFDPWTGDLYIGQQILGRILRVRFALKLDETLALGANQLAVANALGTSFLGTGSRSLRVLSYGIKQQSDAATRQLALTQMGQPLMGALLNTGMWSANIANRLIDTSHLAASGRRSGDQEKFSLFASASVDSFDAGTSLGEADLDLTAYGMVAGGVFRPDRDWLVGMAGTIINFDGTADDVLGTFDADYKGLSLFADYGSQSGFSFGVHAGKGWIDNDYTRGFTLPGMAYTATASPESSVSWLNLRGAYAVEMGRSRFVPEVSLQYSKTTTDAYSETGGGDASLTLDSGKLVSTTASLGGTLEHKLRFSRSDGLVWARAVYVRELDGDAPAVAARFTGAPDDLFATALNDLDGSYTELSAGAAVKIGEGLDLAIRYDGTLGNAGYKQHAVSVRLGLNF